MKERTGFVSNSSSSSFIIRKNERFPDAYALAERMMEERDWPESSDQKKLAIVKRQKKLKNVDGATETLHPNVFFRSCNYDTYILDIGDKLAVQTCNNHNYWQGTLAEADEVSTSSLTQEEIDMIGADADSIDYGELYGLEHSDEYYAIVSGLIGYEVDSWGKDAKGVRCDECWQDSWMVDGELKCPICGRTKDEILENNEARRKNRN